MAPSDDFSGVDFIGSRMREMLDRMSGAGPSQSGGGWSPAVDIYETDEDVMIVVELAGVKNEFVKVIVDGSLVRIYGRRESSCRLSGARYHRMEIETGEFVRSFRISTPFDAKKVEAKTDNGLLCVRMPKTGPPRPQKIEVES